jgi:hypothetical protein
MGSGAVEQLGKWGEWGEWGEQGPSRAGVGDVNPDRYSARLSCHLISHTLPLSSYHSSVPGVTRSRECSGPGVTRLAAGFFRHFHAHKVSR